MKGEGETDKWTKSLQTINKSKENTGMGMYVESANQERLSAHACTVENARHAAAEVGAS